MTTPDPRIVLRRGASRDDDLVVEHPGQPADYVHTDGTAWTWQGRWALVGGVRDVHERGRMVGRDHLRAYDLLGASTDSN
jgi:hypothetical protein